MSGHYITIAGRPIRSWMVTAVLAASSVAYVGLVFVPRQRAIGLLRSELNEKQQHVLQTERLNVPIRQAELRLTSTRDFATQWHDSAPKPDELVGVYAKLAEQAKLADVRLKRVDPQPAVELQTVNEHPLTLSLAGNFSQTFDFLRRIESLPETVWVRSLRASSGVEPGEDLQVELSLTIFADRSEIND